MLTLTDTASTVVRTIATQQLGDTKGGLRIRADRTPDGPAFAVTVAATPEDADQVVDSDGAHVFLEEEAAAALTDKILDASVDENGAVSFSIADAA